MSRSNQTKSQRVAAETNAILLILIPIQLPSFHPFLSFSFSFSFKETPQFSFQKEHHLGPSLEIEQHQAEIEIFLFLLIFLLEQKKILVDVRW
jgi:hypothetical protein